MRIPRLFAFRVASAVCAALVLCLLLTVRDWAKPQQAGTAGPKIWLQDSKPLQVRFMSGNSAAPVDSQSQPLAMDSADVDGDGIPDLVVGYKGGTGGFLAIHRGNLDAFAPQSDASFQAVGRGEFPAPFVAEAQVLPLPITPDFVAIGNFSGGGWPDIVAAARGGSSIYLLAGTGKGRFAGPQVIQVTGAITALAAGNLVNAGPPNSLLLSVSGPDKAFSLLVLGETGVGFGLTASLRLNAPASNFLFAQFGDRGPDAAFLSGGQVYILRPSMQVVPVSLPVQVSAFALGSFIYDRNSGAQIAAVGSDGSVYIAARTEFDPRAYAAAEFGLIRRAYLNHQASPAFVPAPSFPHGWTIVESFAGVGSVPSGQPPLILRARVSSNGADDLMWLGAGAGQMALISHPDAQPGAASFAPGVVSLRPYSGAPVAALSMRVNVDGRPGVVALHQGQTSPAAMMPLPDPTFFPNRFDDIAPRGTGVTCLNTTGADASNDCTLREAIIKANATAGADTIMLQAGTYTLTRGRIASPNYDAKDGTLNINDSLNIVGAVDGGGNPTSIITWGALTSGNSVDMILAVNEDIAVLTTASGTFSNLIIENGVNHGTHSNDGDGGCMEFDTGTNGTASLSLTNVIIQNCATTQGNGGGLVTFDFVVRPGTGTVTISGSTFQNNSAVDSVSGVEGGGIGISAGTLATISNSTIKNNNSNHVVGSQAGIGGGIGLDASGAGTGFGSTTIHNSTISGNKSGAQGGGISDLATGLILDQGTVISGNQSGLQNVGNARDGGGIYLSLVASGCPATCSFPNTVSFSKITIINNTAAGNGGGIFTGSGGTFPTAGPMSISFSRLTGNTAGGSGSNLANEGTTVTATDNWWGTNAPGSTISTTVAGATTSFDPWIELTNTANPSTVNVNTSTTLTASFLQDNHGTPIAASNLDVLLNLPVTWGNPIFGALSNTQTAIVGTGPGAGTATATFTAGPTGFPGPQPQAHADATVDNATVTAAITIPLPPTINKAFNPSQTPLNGTSSLQFTVTNPNTTALTGVAFTDTLPTGLTLASSTATVCGGTLTTTAPTGIALAGATIAGSGQCQFSVTVTGTVAGSFSNTTGAASATESGTGGTSNTATLAVVAPPSIAKAFNPSSIAVNGTTSLQFTITNPAANTVAEAGVAFSDTLPTGLTVANATATVCGGTLTTTAPTGISLAGATIAANSQCQFSVTVTGAAAGQYTNTTGAVSSTNGGTGNTATANLTVANPPSIAKQFGTSQIPLNGTTSLTINLANPNTSLALSGVAFTDSLPAGLVVAATPNLNNTCGGTATAVGGSGSVSLSGGTLAANASCAVSLNVQGTTAGVKNNSVTVSATESGANPAPGTASITVAGAPSLAKVFNPNSIVLNGTSSLQFTITNPNSTVGLTGVGFADTLPTGLTVAGATATVCGGTLTTTAPTGIALTGATVAASGQCQFSVTVTGAAAGGFTNTTGTVTSNEGGTGNTATANLTVVAPPSIAKAFTPAGIQPNGVSALSFTITNPAANTVAEAGVAVTDSLPANLVVATPNGATGNCNGGTLTAVAGSGSITLTGGTVPVNNSCTVSVNVTSLATGAYLNTSGAVTSTNGGTGNTASATLSVANPPTISKLFLPDTVAQGGNVLLSFTITNPNSNSTPPNNDVTLTGISFTDALPAGLVVAASPNVSNDCGGVLTAVAGSSSISLTGGSLGPAVGLIRSRARAAGAPSANGQCFVSVSVQATSTGTKNNTSGPISANESGPGTTSNTASLTVTPPPVPPTVTKAFGGPTVPLNGTTSLTLTFANPNAGTPLVNVSVTDTLPSGLIVANPSGLTGTCVGNADITANPGSNLISMTALSLAGSASCSFSVNVVGIAAGAQNNTTGPVTATFDDGTGTFRPLTGAASNTATVTVLAPDLTISKTHSGTLTQGQVGVVYTITVTNAGTVPTTGTVTVMDTLPAGLTATALSGTGWTCSTPPMLVCTRGDALGAGLSYPVIQLTVNVAINAPASVTNTAVVSGGGETNTANDSATDTASVAQLPGPPLSITPIVGAQVVAAGGTATYNFTVTSSSTQLGGINFACLQLPPLTTCKFTPPSVAAFSGTTQVTMTLTTTAPSVSALPYAPPRAPQAPRGWPAAYAALLALLAVIARSWQLRKERRGRVRLAFGLAALIVVFAFAGCNGSHTTTVGGGTPVGGYAVGVTATSTNAPVVQASTSVNLTVQ